MLVRSDTRPMPAHNAITTTSAPVDAAAGSRALKARIRDIGFDWKFFLGDTASARGVEFDDSGWLDVDLPHDWSIAGPKDRNNPGKNLNGYFPGGVGWYRKHFQLSPGDGDKQVFLQCDGVYENSEMWINGCSLGGRPYGYTGVQHDLTPHVKFGGDNVLAIRVDNSRQPNSRWYTGSGLYRLVRLRVTGTLHVKHWGTVVTTPRLARDHAGVRVRTDVQNAGAQSQDCGLVTRILDPGNTVVGEAVSARTLAARGEYQFDQEITVPNPERWSPDNPSLYRLQTLVMNDLGVCDETETPFGIREARFDKDKGFLLNGEPVKLKGVNLHHDAGCLGAAVPARAWERRLEILKSLGCNAIRTSHNPPAPELLDLCDRMGFAVINEAFDKWDEPFGRWFAQWWQADLADLIRRDRNHPSVILWSVGNELENQGAPEFMKQLEALAAFTRQMDPTRPVTVALAPFKATSHEDNASKITAIARLVDVIGCNYQEQWFEDYRQAYPEIIIVATESYLFYRGKDLDFKAFCPFNPWLDAVAHGYVAGTFYWAGIDYLGEASGWPFHGWNCSLVDTCGFIRPVANLHRSFWTGVPMVHLAVMDKSLDVPKASKSHWDWPEMVSHWNLPPHLEGRRVKVVTFSNCAAVELRLNGRSLGVQALADFPDKMIVWDVPYETGRIEAHGIENGHVKVSHQLQTAGAPAQIQLIADRHAVRADGRDLCHVEVRIVDENGVLVPSARHQVRFTVEGAGRIAGVDNGDLTSLEPYTGNQREVYYGRGLAILQAARHPGTITLTAQADGLPGARISVTGVSVDA